MNDDLVPDALLRRFLLAQVDDSERQRIEQLFITGALSKDRVAAAEEELIDDYLDDCLSSPDKISFLSQYGETVEQQRNLGNARSIRNWAKRNATAEDSPESSSWNVWAGWFKLRSRWLVPVAVSALIVIVAAGIWFVRNAQQRKQFVASEQLLRRINDSQTSRYIVANSSLTLTPVSLRSAGPQAEVKHRLESTVIELRLLWMQKQAYATYTATIRRAGSDQTFTVPDLQPDSSGAAVIRLLLPSSVLPRGLYEIELSGTGNDGRSSSTDEYRLSVTD